MDKETDVVMEEGGDGVMDPDEMEVERALGVEQDPRGGNPKPRTITELRQVIGWLEIEIQRRKRGKNRLSLKEGLRLKKLQKQLWGVSTKAMLCPRKEQEPPEGPHCPAESEEASRREE